jgi:hypothetical protein
VCTAAIRPRSAVYALVERLFDADYGVRGSAIEALGGYPLRDLDLAMTRARHALHSDDLERVAAAAAAIAELADVTAIPDLIEVVGRDARRGEHARRALVALVRCDLGTSERKWRRWWDEHRSQHRIEWLIEALAQKDAALRAAAFEDLRRVAGESFGFEVNGGRRERDEARGRWERWWNETGRRRFMRDDDERARTTAVLPALAPPRRAVISAATLRWASQSRSRVTLAAARSGCQAWPASSVGTPASSAKRRVWAPSTRTLATR